LGLGSDIIGGILGHSTLTVDQEAEVGEIKAAIKQIREKHQAEQPQAPAAEQAEQQKEELKAAAQE
jgi:hypothetical protein